VITFCVALAAILCSASKSVNSQTLDDKQYRLAPGDRINVLVMGQTDLSGTFTVDSSGEIRLPFLGSILVSNRTAAECQANIVEGLSNGFIKQPAVFVRVAEVRPVQILGDVKNPGSFEYRHGSIVKAAIAQAGGYGGPARATSLTPEFLLADERVHVLGATWDRLNIVKARLEAQLAGTASFSPQAPSTISAAEAKRILADEIRMLEIGTDTLRSQQDLLKLQRPLMVAEDAAIQGQIAAETEQINLLRKRISAYDALSGKGLARSSTLLDFSLAESSKQSNVLRLQAERSKLRQTINDLDAKILQVAQAFKERLLTDLRAVQQQLFEIETTLPLAKTQRAARLQAAWAAIDEIPGHTIKITRSRMNSVATMSADDMTQLEPGDIVEVRMVRSKSDMPDATQGGSTGGLGGSRQSL
jgi:polysaccharide biosynthesis/export protein